MTDKPSENDQSKPPPDIDIDDANMLVSDEELSDDPYYLEPFGPGDKEAEIWNTEQRAIMAHAKVYGSDGYRSWVNKEMGWISTDNPPTDAPIGSTESSREDLGQPEPPGEQMPMDAPEKGADDNLDGDIGTDNDLPEQNIETEINPNQDTKNAE